MEPAMEPLLFPSSLTDDVLSDLDLNSQILDQPQPQSALQLQSLGLPDQPPSDWWAPSDALFQHLSPSLSPYLFLLSLSPSSRLCSVNNHLDQQQQGIDSLHGALTGQLNIDPSILSEARLHWMLYQQSLKFCFPSLPYCFTPAVANS